MFTGGISSYALVNMAIAHLQCEGMCGDLDPDALARMLLHGPVASSRPAASSGAGASASATVQLQVAESASSFVRSLAGVTYSGLDLGSVLVSFMHRCAVFSHSAMWL